MFEFFKKLRTLKKIFKKILKEELNMKDNNKKWRIRNKHNETCCKDNIPFDIVSVGKKTYGNINVKYFGIKNEKLEIGNYVSIAENVIFMLGGNHNTRTFTTYPLKAKVLKVEKESTSKGKIIVKDDVWIGTNALILSGVTIGQGAIVAAGSVITKDVEPYCIVGGNPARIIRKRFSDDLINELLEIDFLKLDLEKIDFENVNQFYETIDKEKIQKIKNEFFN